MTAICIKKIGTRLRDLLAHYESSNKEATVALFLLLAGVLSDASVPPPRWEVLTRLREQGFLAGELMARRLFSQAEDIAYSFLPQIYYIKAEQSLFFLVFLFSFAMSVHHICSTRRHTILDFI